MKQPVFAKICRIVVCGVFIFSFSSIAVAGFKPFQPLPAVPPVPDDNPMSGAKAELGKQLFFDTRLSSNNSMSCNSCHNVMAGGEDGQARSVGASGRLTKRNSPSLWNSAFHTRAFLDGRAESLEAAINTHWFNPTIMDMAGDDAVMDVVSSVPGYRQQLTQVFGGGDAVSYKNVVKAVATYIRTLVTVDGPFDRHLRGDDSALSDAAKRGFHAFIERGCASCHFYVNMAGPVPGLAFEMGEGFYELFPNHVVPEYEEKYGFSDDLGRYLVTHDESHKRLWRVPSLRNVAVTSPYFHNGKITSLSEAVRIMAKTQLQLTLDEGEVADIVEFLHSLTGAFPEQTLPRIPAQNPDAP